LRIMKHFAFVVVFWMIVIAKSKLICVDKDHCTTCSSEESNNDYCRETGRRIKVICTDSSVAFEDFRSCQFSSEDDKLRMVAFQIAMAVIGGIAYWGVQVRKTRSLSLFDNRKIRR